MNGGITNMKKALETIALEPLISVGSAIHRATDPMHPTGQSPAKACHGHSHRWRAWPDGHDVLASLGYPAKPRAIALDDALLFHGSYSLFLRYCPQPLGVIFLPRQDFSCRRLCILPHLYGLCIYLQ